MTALLGARRLSVSAGLVFAARIGGSALRLGVQVVLARWLGSAAFGVFVVGRGWGELLAKLPNAGLESSALRWLPRWSGPDGASRQAEFVRTGRRLTFVRAVVLSGVLILALWALGLGTGPLSVGLLLIVTMSLGMLFVAIAHGLGELVKSTTLFETAQPLVFAVLVAALHGLDRLTPTSALIALVVASGTTSALQGRLVDGRLPTAAGSGVRSSLLEWPSDTRLLYLSQLSIAAINQAGLLVIGAVDGATAAGLFAVAQRIGNVGRMGTSAVEAVAAPSLAATATLPPDRARTEQQALVDRAIRTAAGPALAFCTFGIVFSAPLVEVFGSEFAPARSALIVLLVAHTLESLTGPSGYLLSTAGSVRLYTTIMTAHALALVVVSVPMVHRFGLFGGALAQGAIIVSWNVALVVAARRSLGVFCLPGGQFLQRRST